MKKFFMLFVVMLSHITAQIVWDSPINLSTLIASDPQVVVDPSGNITAAWVENGFIKANTRPVGGNWGIASTVSLLGGCSSPRLGVDDSGNVTAVWVQSGFVTTSIRALGIWSVLPIALSGAGASAPSLAVDGAGDVAVVWVRGGFIEAQQKPSGGIFNLNSSVISSANSDHPDVAIGSNGNILAVWHNNSNGADLVYSSTAVIGGNWSASKTITPAGLASLDHNYPKAAVDSSGNGYALWYRYTFDGTNYLNVSVLTSVLSANTGNWAPIPTLLSQGGMINPSLLTNTIRVDSDGNAVAIWTTSFDNNTFQIESSSVNEGGNWLTTIEVVSSNLYSFAADAATNSSGSIASIDMYFDGSTSSIESRESDMTGPFENFWSTPVVLSNGTNQGYPKIATAYIPGQNQSKYGVVWLASVSGTNTVQSVTGTLTNLNPPTNVGVVQSSTSYGVFTDYTNTLTWTASTSPNLFGYAIYRNGIHMTDVGANLTLEYVEHNQVQQNGSVSYSVVAIDNFGTQSQKITVNI
ncbi:MAG TPA: hypothetical protein VLE96_04740 [Chlamydiales bacterium]|nr:hypothetical protein [Chlamydiales bacterium]